MRKLLILFLLLFATTSFSQELNCNVIVNAEQTGDENQQVFKTLQRQLNEFVNKTKWTSRTFKPQERINCGMVITIQEYSSDVYSATIQVQSSRPTFGSSYATPVYNFNDKDFTFRYIEFQNLIFNKDQFESNLVSTIAFHIYMVFGLDADTFSQKGGDEYFKLAQRITNYSQQSNFKGWKPEDGLQSRYYLIENMLSPKFSVFRNVMYKYHIKGLDIMHEDIKAGKESIANTLTELESIHRQRPNSFILRTFFDAKAEEIQDVFSSGPSVNISKVVNSLQKVAPLHSNKWRKIKF